MTNEKPMPSLSPHDNVPFIYFDRAPTFGILNGAVQIEVAADVLYPIPKGVDVRTTLTAHLRCSPAGAMALMDAIKGALDMLQQPQANPPSGPTN